MVRLQNLFITFWGENHVCNESNQPQLIQKQLSWTNLNDSDLIQSNICNEFDNFKNKCNKQFFESQM